MRKRCVMVAVALFAALVFIGFEQAQAGAPFTNAEGVGGVALNPMAYIANPIKKGDKGLFGLGIVSKPQLGIWNIRLCESGVDWFTVGGNISFFNRLELGYSHEFVSIEDVPKTVDKNNFSFKLNLLKENEFGMKFLPAVSFGGIYKTTDADDDFDLKDTEDIDLYFVATKMVPGLPVPVILNAGILGTKGFVRGVLGFGDDREWVFFGNIDVVLFKQFIVGWEYEQEAEVGNVFKGEKGMKHTTHSMWEAHIAWMYNDHLTLIGSYAYTGDSKTSGQAAFDSAYVLSLQYAF